MPSRREFLEGIGVGAAGLLLPWTTPRAQAATPIDPGALTKYVDALPIPGVLSPTHLGGSHYRVEMSQFEQKLHRDLPRTTVWGYNSAYPGPTFEVRKGKPVTVEWVNNLPSRHLFALDTTIDDSPASLPAVRVSPHLHGGHILSAFDGQPNGWFSPGSPPKRHGPAYPGTTTFQYSNDQQAATLWYHDHALGVTRLNVYAGLAGFYLLRDDIEDSLNLPRGRFEIPLVLQDRALDASGQLFYPDTGGPMSAHPIWTPEFTPTIALVNGKVWPYLEVEPRKYRFRMLNGSNTRFYSLHLSSKRSITQIGSDGGLLPEPVTLTDCLLAPAERADVILDFKGHEGEFITVANDAPNGEQPLSEIMQFRVTLPLSGRDTSSLPTTLPPFRRLHPGSAVKSRSLNLNHILNREGKLVILQMGPNFEGLPFLDPLVTEKPRNGTTEIWSILNLTPVERAHPIHLHLVQFQILDRQDFDFDLYVASRGRHLRLLGDRIPPDPNEMGWKDTVRANPKQVTRIIARFDPLPNDQLRKFMWHCHILEHEDNSMMRPYIVV